MKKLDFTLLGLDDINGENRLSIFDKYGTRAAITDFAILLGGMYNSNFLTKEGNDLKDRAGNYFSKTCDVGEKVPFIVNENGYIRNCLVNSRIICARPVLPYSSIIKDSLNKRVNNLGVYEVEFGEYPQTIVDERLSRELEKLYNKNILKKLYNKNILKKTRKGYTTDSRNNDEYVKPFKKRKHIEYEYNGEKYIRILGDYNSKGETLSDGRVVEEGKPYFVKVEPIVWLVDKERDIAVSKKLLFAGVQFDNKIEYTGNFNSTNVCFFLNNHFSKDTVPSKIENKKEYTIKELKEKTREVIEEAISSKKNDMEIVPYLVKYENSDESFGAYELDGILRDIITSLQIVNKSNRKSKNVIKCASKEETTFKVLSSYCLEDMSERERLEYAKKISELGKNEKLHKMYLDQIEKVECREKVIEHVRSLQLK